MKIYDDIDMRNHASANFWKGVLVGSGLIFFMCLFAGLYLNS